MNWIQIFEIPGWSALALWMLRSAVLLAAGLLAAFFLARASAATRHWILTITLVAVIALPFFGVLASQWKPALPAGLEISVPVAAPAGVDDPLPAALDPAAILPEAGMDARLTSESYSRPIPWKRISIFIWLAGACLVLARTLCSAHWLARLRNRCRKADPELEVRLGRICRGRRLRRPVGLLILPEGETSPPMTWGLRKAWIALPAAAGGWSNERLDVVFEHELVHIERNDPHVLWLCQIICALQWCNPLAWMAARRIGIESENACDDLVLSRGAPARIYADTVLKVAANSQRPLLPTMAMARAGNLESRLRRILDSGLDRRTLRLRARLGALLGSGVIAIALALFVTGPSNATPPEEGMARPGFDIVIIDAGHGGRDSGSPGKRTSEAKFTLDVALHLKRQLNKTGLVKVVTTRERDVLLSHDWRLEYARKHESAVLVSLHFNASPDDKISGTTVYYSPMGHPDSGDLALRIGESLKGMESPGFRGVQPGNFALARDPGRPAVLVDGGFLTNDADHELIETRAYRKKLAERIADGLLRFQGGAPHPETREKAAAEEVPTRESTTGPVRNVSAKVPLTDGFSFPVPVEEYYKARGFAPGGHRGEDWNGKGGGNTDLGDPVYAIGDGLVVHSSDLRLGYGQVILLRHRYRDRKGEIRAVDSYYGPLRKRFVQEGDVVKHGQKIGEIGNNRGMYFAHLCFQIRKNIDIGVQGRNYPVNYDNYHNPTRFIRDHPPAGN